MSTTPRTRKRGNEQGTPGSSTTSTLQKKLQCPSCPYSTDSHSNLKVHNLRIHVRSKPFECSFCPFKCTLHEGLQSHYRSHTREKPFPCRQCKREFAEKNSLKAHVLTQHDEIQTRSFRCEQSGCKSTFKLRRGLYIHTQRVHKKSAPEKRFPCGLCPKVLKTQTGLQYHLGTHTGEKPFKCPQCDFAATHKVYLNNHLHVQHTDQYNYPCDFPACGAKFKRKSIWKRHVDRVHKKITRFRCSDCPKEFYAHESMIEHHARVHSNEKTYECDLCEFRAATRPGIAKHKKYTHSEYLILECTLCSSKFKNADTLQQHRNREHTGKPRDTKLFACLEPECGKEYRSKVALKGHIRGCHTEGSKQFSCPFCPYTSNWSANLMVHMRQHTGEAPYKCDDCGKCFRDQTLLRGHKQHIHSQERPFKCTLCAYQGKTRGNFREHVKTHNPNPFKGFSCSVCSYKCTTKTVLRRHSVTHQDERSFACQVCSFKAKRIDVLRIHIQRHSVKRLRTCSKCQRAYRTDRTLLTHLCTHNDDRPFVCGVDDCNGRFKTDLSRLVHRKKQHKNEIQIECPCCPEVLTRRWEYEEHIRIRSVG